MALLPKFVEGVPELDLPPLDPFAFDMDEIRVRQGNLHGGATLRNSTAEGNGAMRFTQVRANLRNPGRFEMDIDFHHPTLFVEGEYDVEGRLVMFNLNGSGVFNASMSESCIGAWPSYLGTGEAGIQSVAVVVVAENINSTWKLRGELTEGEDGLQYMKLTRFGLAARVGSFKLYASNLFGGNKEVNKAILGFVNKSWRVLHRRVASAIDKSFNSSMLHVANKVFLKVPYDQLFPLQGNATSSAFTTDLPTDTEATTTEDELDYDFSTPPSTPSE
ncbi:hypothetical protein C0J52_00607 [Blattella germanica]|nr:hypothetical protein C0J52_00607 [Blattella germanica]